MLFTTVWNLDGRVVAIKIGIINQNESHVKQKVNPELFTSPQSWKNAEFMIFRIPNIFEDSTETELDNRKKSKRDYSQLFLCVFKDCEMLQNWMKNHKTSQNDIKMSSNFFDLSWFSFKIWRHFLIICKKLCNSTRLGYTWGDHNKCTCSDL